MDTVKGPSEGMTPDLVTGKRRRTAASAGIEAVIQGSSWTRLPIKGWDHSDGPQESNRTWRDVPSDPVRVTMPLSRSICVTV